MRTYVAAISGEAVFAFRAHNDDGAWATVHDRTCGVQAQFLVTLRADGGPVWDGRSTILVRQATDGEHRSWLCLCGCGAGGTSQRKLVDLKLDEVAAYLIPLDVDEDDVAPNGGDVGNDAGAPSQHYRH
jgi:hypothetical protein